MPTGSGTVKDKAACPTHQEEHALLKPLPGELAEAAQADEFLQSRQKLGLLRGRQSPWCLDSGLLSPPPSRDSTALNSDHCVYVRLLLASSLLAVRSWLSAISFLPRIL